jgi:hypothetical protein
MTNGTLLQSIIGIIFVIWSAAGCSTPTATLIPPTAIPTPEPPTATSMPESPTAILTLVPIATTATTSLVTDQSLSNPLSLTYNANIYHSSPGGQLANGCKAWQTMLKTGENIFASKCDPSRLESLGLYAAEAIGLNSQEVASRRITDSGTYIMIDFEGEKSQALYGVTSNNSDAYLILNANKEYIFYRTVGTRDQLKELGFLVDALLAANDSVDTRFKIEISGDQLNLAEDKNNGAQLLVGKTSEGTTIALVVDRNGTFIGYRTQP